MSSPATAVTNSAVDRSWTPRTRRPAGTTVRYGRIENPTMTHATTHAAMSAPPFGASLNGVSLAVAKAIPTRPPIAAPMSLM